MFKYLLLSLSFFSLLSITGCQTYPQQQESQQVTPPPVSNPQSFTVRTEGITQRLERSHAVYLSGAADARDGFDFVDESGDSLQSYLEQAITQYGKPYKGDSGQSLTSIMSEIGVYNGTIYGPEVIGKLNAGIKYIFIPRIETNQVSPENISVNRILLGTYVQKVGSFENEFRQYGSFVTDIDITGSVDIVVAIDVYDCSKKKPVLLMTPKLVCHADNWHLTSEQPLNNTTYSKWLLRDARENANFYTKEGLTNYITKSAFYRKEGFFKTFVTKFVDALYQ